MFETPFTVVGTVITDPVLRRVGEHEHVRFRVASNSRRRTPDGNWETGNSLFLGVSCWGKVADGVAGVIFKGDPVVVVGQIYTNEYDDKDGNRRSAVEVRASSVGPDLTRCRIKVDRSQRVAEPMAAPGPDAADDAEHPDEDSELSLSA